MLARCVFRFAHRHRRLRPSGRRGVSRQARRSARWCCRCRCLENRRRPRVSLRRRAGQIFASASSQCLALAHLSRNSFGNLTPRKKPRFRKFPGKSDLRRRVGWVQYAPTRRSRSVSYVSPFGTFRHFDAQAAVSLVGLRAPPAIRPRGMSSSESPRDRLSRLRKRGFLSLDEYLREIELTSKAAQCPVYHLW